jgi:hypothetical protein
VTVDLERVAVALRPRRNWEAVDLGFALARARAAALFPAFALAWLPTGLLAGLLAGDNLIVAALVLWWAKPAFDRIALHVLSQSMFGEPPSVRDTLRGILRYVNPGLIASLTIYRFDMARSFNLPIWQLERQKGREARQRAKALHRRTRGTAVMLLSVCAMLELVVVLGLGGIVELLTPGAGSSIGELFHVFGSNETTAGRQWSTYGFWLLAVVAIEPFFVAGGFALYLNRRIELEAWDIELAFRRLAARVPPARPARAAVVFLAGALVAALGGAPADAPAAAKQPATEIKDILMDPVFDEYETRTEWRYRGPGSWWNSDDEKPRQGASRDGDWAEVIRVLAMVVRALAWGLAAALLVGAIVYLSRYLGRLQAGGNAYRPPDALFGMDLRPESLPDDVAGAARDAILRGDVTAGLSLLYRGALSVLVHRDGVELGPSHTEGDCVGLVRRDRPLAVAAYFAALAAAWQGAAYAHRVPAVPDLDRLCSEWPAHFVVPRTEVA